MNENRGVENKLGSLMKSSILGSGISIQALHQTLSVARPKQTGTQLTGPRLVARFSVFGNGGRANLEAHYLSQLDVHCDDQVCKK